MVNPEHPSSISAKLHDLMATEGMRGTFAKRGIAIAASVVLCGSMVPICIEHAAFADESADEFMVFQGVAAPDEYDAQILNIFDAAMIESLCCASIPEIESTLSECGYTIGDILEIDTTGLREADPALADAVAALQYKIISEGDSGSDAEDDPGLAGDGDDEGDEEPADGEEGGDEAAGGDDLDAAIDPDGEGQDAASPSEAVQHPLSVLNPETDKTSYPQWTYSGSTEYVHMSAQQTLTAKKLIAMIAEQARQIAAENDLYASVMIAQAVLESDSGNSQLAKQPNFNLFGIKGSYNGQSVTLKTREDDGSGNIEVISADFRKYPNYSASLEDYAHLLSEEGADLYQGARKSAAPTPAEACEHLQGRYATDTAYAAKLMTLIDAYDLTRYDVPLDYALCETYQVELSKADAAISKTVDLETGETVVEERDLTDLAAEVTSHLGEDYVWGGSSCGGFDCSGLVSYAYKQALGVTLPRTTYYQCLLGEDVDFADLHTGDLMFFADKEGVCVHVGMYLAEGCYIEAPYEGEVVRITSFEEKEPTFAKRICKTIPVDADEDPLGADGDAGEAANGDAAADAEALASVPRKPVALESQPITLQPID